MTRDLKAKKDKKEKDSRKRKSDSALPSSKSSKSSKMAEKTKSRPKPKRPDALALLQQIETGGRSESPKMSKQEPSYTGFYIYDNSAENSPVFKNPFILTSVRSVLFCDFFDF